MAELHAGEAGVLQSASAPAAKLRSAEPLKWRSFVKYASKITEHRPHQSVNSAGKIASR
jgi:hypothetical protein